MTDGVSTSSLPAAAGAESGVSRRFFKAIAWAHLGLYDIRGKYRRTYLGPIWASLTTAGMIGCLAVVYGTIFDLEWQTYLPYLTAGIIIWQFVSKVILESALALTSHRNVLLSVPLGPIYPIIRIVVRATSFFAHDLAVFAAVAVATGVGLHATQLLALPALALFGINGLTIGLSIALLSARFRDVQQLLGMVVSVLFLVTPVLWKPELLGDRQFIADINPATHFVAILRDALLGDAPRLASWSVVLGCTMFFVAAAYALHRRARRRFVFWL